MKKYNYDAVIVEMHTIIIYDFVLEGESTEEAEARGLAYYKEWAQKTREYSVLFDDDSAYWHNQADSYDKKVAAGCRVMSLDDFRKLQKKRLLLGDPEEITAEKFDEMLNILPPLKWVTINNIEMFCMCEMYTGSYTTQYAHDKKNNKYYSKMVDVLDRSTWLHNFL